MRLHNFRSFFVQLLPYFGIGVSIFILGLLSKTLGIPMLIAPFGASAVLLFLYPNAPFSQLKNVGLSYFVIALISWVAGVLLVHEWSFIATLVALCIFVVEKLKATHPPAAGIPILLFLLPESRSHILMTVVIGVAVLWGVSRLTNWAIQTLRSLDCRKHEG